MRAERHDDAATHAPKGALASDPQILPRRLNRCFPQDKNYIPRNRSDYTPYDTYENVGKAGQRLLDKGSPEAALRDASDEDFEDVDVTFASSGGLRGLVLCCLGDCCVSQDTFM
eukprot:scaffold1311_cov256-Pinguiococcus_pyrenoidosus.AAC.9